MIPDLNWARWVFASVSKVFKEASATAQLDMFIEGTDKPDRRDDKDYLEFRMNGPDVKEPSFQYFEIRFEVNLLVCSIKDQRNFHRLWKNIGIAQSLFIGSISIYKYGDGTDDDQSFLGCALLETNGDGGSQGGNGINTQNFGQWDPTLNVSQATVDGRYKLTLAFPLP